MFSKAAIVSLVSAIIVSAAPNSWSQPDPTCSAVTSWSTYESETKVAYYKTETHWQTTNYTVDGVVTETIEYPSTKTIVTWTPKCIETSWPVTIMVTKEITTQDPVTHYETCTESKVIEVPTCTTVWTVTQKLDVCTEYSSVSITTAKPIVSTACDPWSEQPTVTVRDRKV